MRPALRFRHAVTTVAATAVALTVAPGLVAGAEAATAASTSHTLTVRGSYHHLVADGRRGHADLESDVVVSGGRTYKVRLAPGQHIANGSSVTVSGRAQTSATGTALLGRVTPWTHTTRGAHLASTASRYDRVLVILATWTTPDAVTQASAAQQFFSDDNAWFNEASYGAYGITGDVTPWVTIAGPLNGLCMTYSTQTLDQARSAALALGYDSSTYNRTVVYFPSQSNPDCSGYAGWSYQPGNVVWLNGAMNRRTTVHEQGHNLGLSHAHADVCQNASGVYVSYSATCTSDEYGDPYDAMGASDYSAHFSAAMKAQLGWGTNRAVDLSAGGTATLAPMESETGTPYVSVTAAGQTFYVESRKAIGMDSALPADATGGVLIHDFDPTTKQASLLDMAPDGDFNTPALPTSRNWQLPDGRWLNVYAPNASGIPVSVTATAADVTPPKDVTRVTASVRKGTLTLGWTSPTDKDLAKVTVRVTRDGSDPRLSGTAIFAALGTSVSTTAPGATPLRFVITTADKAGNASAGVSGSVTSVGKLALS